MSTIRTRFARAEDAETLAEFNIAMARESEGMALDPVVVRSGVRRLLAAPAQGFYVVAEIEKEVAGALMVTSEWSDWRDGEFWWIQSVYVRPALRRRGVYRRLYDFVKREASESGGVRGFRLYVERENEVAQAVYRKLGMRETGYRVFEELVG